MDENKSSDEIKASRFARLDALSKSLVQKRTDAINGRANLGIEDDWQTVEDAYAGVDSVPGSVKPSTIDGTIQRKTQPSTTKSTVYLNITRPYVDAASAKLSDMLLPTDDKNWGMKPTPVPELSDMKGDQTPIINPATAQPVVQEGKTVTVDDFVKRLMDEADKRCKAAERRITDWLVECQFNSEVRKVIENSALYGTGIMKGPFPKVQKSSMVTTKDGVTTIELSESIKPTSKSIVPWNFYPDPSCGDNIHNGAYCFEVDELNGRQVEELKNDSSYIAEAIDEVLEEGPNQKASNRKLESANLDKETYEVWYFSGFITKDDMEACGCECDSNFTSFPALVTMINDTVVKATLQPLDSGKFPYDVMVWSKMAGSWVGQGIGIQINTPQRMLNAATRNMMDNAGNSAGPQIFIKRKGITPADGSYQLYGNKLWFIEDDDVLDARTAIQSVVIDSRQVELMNIVQFALKMAEDVTGLPMLMQGQQGKAPETVGGMQMLNNNASTVLRRIARNFDDMLTEPHIRAYYEWLLIYGEDESEKGDFKVEVRGSSALVERDIQNQAIAQILQLSLNPAFGINPKNALAEWLKSQRLSPTSFEYTEEEMQKLAEQQPPVDPRIQAAQINNQTKVQLAQAQQQESLQELEIRNKHLADERAQRLQEMQLTREIEMLKLANNKEMSLEQIKADLAKTAMNIKNDRELFSAEAQLKREQGSGI
jgi:hypothetical protein